MTKREFLRVAGFGASVVIAGPAGAWAQRRRILRGHTATDILVSGQSQEFRRFLGEIRIGQARAHGALLVFWLHGGTLALPLPISTLEEARARGDLLITERRQPTVPDLIVDNRGKTHVLLLAGEILVGGKQSRVLTEDILLPPLSGPINIGVYCVEQGRWAGSSASFSAKGFAASGLRSRLMERADQQQVWTEVRRYSDRVGATSPTESYEAIQDKPEVKAHQREVERRIDHRAAPGAVGAAVFAGDRFTGLDLFQDPDLFAREWPKLLHAHAVETFGSPRADTPNERKVRLRVLSVLERAARAKGTLRRNAGVGQLFEFRVDRFRGSALVAESQVIHAAIV